MKIEKIEIIKIIFKAKTQIILKTSIFADFKDCFMIIEVKSIIVIQKNQVKKLVLINVKDNVKKQQYM